MSSFQSSKVSKNKGKTPVKISVLKSFRPLKFFDSVLCHQPQLGSIIRAKPCAVPQHPDSQDRATSVFPEYHTTACALQCLAQTLKSIEVAREHVDHLSRIISPSKPRQVFDLIDKSRQRLDRIYHVLDDTFYPIFDLLKEQFDLDQLIENDSNPKLIKKGGKVIEISPIGWTLKKESDQQKDPFLSSTIQNQPEDVFQFIDE